MSRHVVYLRAHRLWIKVWVHWFHNDIGTRAASLQIEVGLWPKGTDRTELTSAWYSRSGQLRWSL